MKIYLASNYSTHPLMREVAKGLKAHGHEITGTWIEGTHDSWPAVDCAEVDLRDLDAADAIMLFSGNPARSRSRGGKNVEFGYALAKGKLLFLVGEPVNVFHYLPNVVRRATWQDFVPVLKQHETYPDYFNA
jgi:hypothetical protein